jgi:hypothetical protein
MVADTIALHVFIVKALLERGSTDRAPVAFLPPLTQTRYEGRTYHGIRDF